MYADFALAVLLSFAMVAAAMPFAIPVLHKLKFGQEVRDDGPKAHLKKQGTPTMGGAVFILAILLVGLFFAGKYPRVLPVLFLTFGFGVIGFIDDYLKVVHHHSEGFNPKQKFICQLLITLAFALFLYRSPDFETAMRLPFTEYKLELGPLYIPAVLFIVTATDNGANFTDGVDGLCSAVTAVISVFLAAVSVRTGNGDLVPCAGAVFGALLGFLCFNAYPAKVFMGDTGSLALGGFVAAMCFAAQIPLFIPVFAFVYLMEVLSVILQVTYFKATHGKRIFRMAPIHHHFELGGWSETRVVVVFTVVTILCSILSLLALR